MLPARMDPWTPIAVVVALLAAWLWWRDRRRVHDARTAAAAADRRAEALDTEADERAEVQDTILTAMVEGVLLLGPDGSTAFANPALDRHLGGRPAGIGELFPARLREAAAAPPVVVEVELDNPSRWLRAQVVEAGGDGSILVIVTDVTAQRRLDAVRRDFVANASHELKTPAATIRAAAETLVQASADDPDAVPRFAAQLEREAMRLGRIVADLLDLSRLESGAGDTEDVRIDALVREECQRFEDDAAQAGLSFVVETPDPATVHGAPRDLALLARNLIDNAVRYTGPGGTVTVSVAVEDPDVVLRVTDTGVGIPSRDASRIFERFYRVDRARSRETGGTGLGLAIVKHVADNHGAAIEVESELGVGTAVTVRIPSAAP
jgi:signal transduction histidine kinase